MTTSNPSVFFIDLDTLFDTRLGTLITYMYDDLVKIFDKELYHNRLDDSFNKQIDKDVFYKHYNNRDKRVLANSTLSLMPDIIHDFIMNVANTDMSSPYSYHPHLCVNVYPYTLTDEEVDNISIGLDNYFKGKVDIELVNMSLESITTKFVKNNVTVMAMYEYHKWLDLQTVNDGFKETSCSDTTLLAPRLFFTKLPATQLESDEIFKSLESISKPFINLELIPSMFFSTYLVTNLNKNEKT